MVFWCFLSIVSSQVEVSILTSGIHKCIANKVAEIRSLTLKLQIFRTANQSSHHQSYDIGHSPCRRPWPLSFLPSATLHLLPEARSLSKWRNKSMMIYECQQEMWGCWPKWQKWGPEFELGRVLFLFTCFFSFRLLFSFHPVLVLFWGNALPACLSLVINLVACYREMHIRRGVLVLLCSYCCREINARHGVFGGVVLLA